MTDASNAPQKSFMMINRRPPHGTSAAQEALDATLMAGVFNQQVTVVFLDDGVYQLLKDQQPEVIHSKNTSATLPMLAMYEIDTLLVEQESMIMRGLSEADFVVPVTVIPAHQLGQLMAEQDAILSF